jgi:hypothetical protein
MSVATKELIALAARQHHAITDAQLKSLGLSARQRNTLVRDGWLERLLDGAYRIPGAAELELARCVAACARPHGLTIAGPTAGRLWRRRRMPNDGLVYCIAPPRSQPSVEPWLIAYRTAHIRDIDIVERADGIRVTSPPRTAVDLMRYLPPEDVRSVVDQMISERLCTLDTLRRTAEWIATPGRPWARQFLEMLETRAAGGAAESHWESLVGPALVEAGVPDVRLQRWLDLPGWPTPIRLDACVDAVRWGVEVDAHPEHFTEEGGDRDRARDLACAGIGWHVSRVTGRPLGVDFDGAIRALVAAYEARCRDLGVLPYR